MSQRRLLSLFCLSLLFLSVVQLTRAGGQLIHQNKPSIGRPLPKLRETPGVPGKRK